MARARLSMRKTKEVLRLKLCCGLTDRQIARSCQVSRSTVAEYLSRANRQGLTGEDLSRLTDEELESRLFGPVEGPPSQKKPLPDFEEIHKELRHHKHVTLWLLWEEYKQQHPDGYERSWFYALYRQWQKQLDPVMRQDHKGGEKLFVDYCDGLPLVDPGTAEQKTTQLFEAVWGASNYTYAEASLGQDLHSWIGSHVRAFAYFQCVPHVVVPDNLRSGVRKVCRYEPDLNPTYLELAMHYATTVIPARVGHPRDKAKVEVGVQVAQRWILAVLRHRRFTGLGEMNGAIRALLQALNSRKLRKMKQSRKELFVSLDAPNALPLPERPYEYAEWKKARVNIDYHLEVDAHYYSVPYQFIGDTLDMRLTAQLVEVFRKGVRIASHLRSSAPHQHTTIREHMPVAHQRYLEWTPSRMVDWASTVGPSTKEFVRALLDTRKHPEQAYRSVLGILRLARQYGGDRLEKATRRALGFRALSYRSVKNILSQGLEQEGVEGASRGVAMPFHDNIRGSRYYEEKEGGVKHAQ